MAIPDDIIPEFSSIREIKEKAKEIFNELEDYFSLNPDRLDDFKVTIYTRGIIELLEDLLSKYLSSYWSTYKNNISKEIDRYNIKGMLNIKLKQFLPTYLAYATVYLLDELYNKLTDDPDLFSPINVL